MKALFGIHAFKFEFKFEFYYVMHDKFTCSFLRHRMVVVRQTSMGWYELTDDYKIFFTITLRKCLLRASLCAIVTQLSQPLGQVGLLMSPPSYSQ